MLRRLPAVLAALVFAASALVAAPPAHAEERVLLVGDSWAEFFWVNGSLREVFAANGSPEITEVGGATTDGGTEASDWTSPARLQSITDALAAHPTIDVVQLTLGGNDVLEAESGGGWYVGISPAEKQALYERIEADLRTVIEHVLGLRPDLRVLLSLYDYPNFEDASPVACGDLYADLGRPTPVQINTVSAELEAHLQGLIGDYGRVSFVSHLGLMQETYGFPDRGIQPGDITRPGDLTLPTPVEAILSLGPINDCIHLDRDGYRRVAQNLWESFYRDYFRGAPVEGCEADAGTLCLNDDRFEVTISYETPDGQGSPAALTELTADTGIATFRNPQNVELIVKVLDACSQPTPRYWVFLAGLTNLKVEVTVRDTETGARKVYRNPLRNPFPPVQDTQGFATCP